MKLFITFIFIGTLPLFASFEIALKTYNLPKDQVVLFRKLDLNKNSREILDTLKLDKDGRIRQSFEYEPGIYQIDLVGLERINLAADNNQLIGISADMRGKRKKPFIDILGARPAELVAEYEKQRKKLFRKYVAPVQEKIKSIQAKGDMDSLKLLTAEEDMQREKYLTELAAYGKNYLINSIAFFYAAIRMDGDRDLELLSQQAEWFQENRPELELTKQLHEKVERFKKLALNKTVPDINMPALNGDTIKLSNLRGNYVLVDFWASWCLPCRQENQNYVSLYKKYKKKGFEIFAVSLDTKKELWEQAIKKDKADWIHVSSLDGWNSDVTKEFNLLSIPANFLINPQGKIIAKNIRGIKLENKLKEIF